MHRATGKGGVLRLRTALLLPLILLVLGCVTAPSPEERDLGDLLLPGQSVYFAAHVAGNRDLVLQVAEAFGADAGPVVNRIDRFAGSLGTGVSGDVPALSGAATGRFPEDATRYALWRDRAFRRSVEKGEEGRFVYYRQVDGALEIAVPERGLILLTTASVTELARATGFLSTGGDSPTGDNPPTAGLSDRELRESLSGIGTDDGPDILVVVPDPARFLAEQLALVLPRFPIERITLEAFSVTATDTGAAADADAHPVTRMELQGRFELQSEMQSALFSRLGRGFILAFVRALGLPADELIDSVTLATNGAELVFGGLTVGVDDLAGILSRMAGREI